VLHAKIVYIGRCFAKYLAIFPVVESTTKRSTLLSKAICVAVVHSMSVTLPDAP